MLIWHDFKVEFPRFLSEDRSWVEKGFINMARPSCISHSVTPAHR